MMRLSGKVDARPKVHGGIICPRNHVAGSCLDAQRVKVSFRLPYKANFGEKLCMVGSPSPLGEWDLSRGVCMTWTEGDIWRVDLEMDLDDEQHYKYFVKGTDGSVVNWMRGNNIALKLPSDNAATMSVLDTWDGSSQDVAWDESGAQQEPQEQELNFSKEEEVVVVRSAARRAFTELDRLLEDAMALMAHVADPADPEALSADLKISGQARKALALAGAMEVAQEMAQEAIFQQPGTHEYVG